MSEIAGPIDVKSTNSLQHTKFMQICNNSFALYGSYQGVDYTCKSVIVALINNCHANIYKVIKPLYSGSTYFM